MKPSKYNICLPYDDRFVIFNGVTKRFFLVSSQNKKAFLQILSTPDEYKEQYAPFLQRMAKEGFIIEDDVDELEVVKQQYHDLTHDNSYKLMILPTYACNVSCWYCTQNHRNMQLSDDDVERVKKHIAYYLPYNGIKRLQLAWFGGEPLLSFHRIEEIASFAKAFCQKHSISYHNTITTNGTLLSRRILEKMKDLDFTFFQITVDGTKNEHDKVKVIKGKSAYEMTLRNICLISEILPDAEICLRYNYTTDNLEPDAFIMDLEHYLPESVRKRIDLSIMKVWQEDEKNIDGQELETLVTSASDALFNVSVGQGFYPCYVDNIHFNSVFPNGRIGKCDNLDPDSAQGHLAETGEIVWDKEIPAMQFTVFDDHESECLSCQYLPICNGPCPKERDQACLRKEHLKCRFQDADRLWNQDILYYCRRFLHLLLLIIIPYIVYAQTDSTKVAMKDSIYKSVDLKEVTVQASNLLHRGDKDIWLITDEMRKNTFDTFSLIAKIPGMYYDKKLKSLFYNNRDNVLLLIDGKEKTNSYIGQLANLRFKKIEVTEHPRGRYSDYYAVINVITKDNWEGHEIDAESYTIMKPVSDYDQFFTYTHQDLSYTYARPGLNVAAHYDYTHRNEHKYSTLYKRNNNLEMHSIEEGKPTDIRFYNIHNSWIDADFDISKYHSISAKFVYRTANDDTRKEYLMSSNQPGGKIFRRISDTETLLHTYIASLFYRGMIGKTRLYSDFTYNRQNSKPVYAYSESTGYETTNESSNYRSFTQFRFDTSTQFSDGLSLNAGYLNYNRWSDIRQNGVTTNSGMYRNRLYAVANTNILPNFRWQASGAIEWFRSTANGISDSNSMLWEAGTSLRYNFNDGKNELSLRYQTQTSYPQVYQTNAVEVRIDSLLVMRGNPLLKPTTLHDLSLECKIGIVRLEASIEYCKNYISPVYKRQEDGYLLTYDNIGQRNCLLGIFVYKNFNLSETKNLILCAHAEQHFSKLNGGSSSSNLSFQTGGFYADYSCGSWGVSFGLDKRCTYQLSANTEANKGDDWWTFSVRRSFLKDRLNVDVSYVLPVKLGITRNRYEWTNTPYYENRYQYDYYASQRHTVDLTVTYKFAKGHQVRKKNNRHKEENEDFILNE